MKMTFKKWSMKMAKKNPTKRWRWKKRRQDLKGNLHAKSRKPKIQKIHNSDKKINVHTLGTLAIDANADAAVNNFGGVDNILEEGVMDGSEGARVGALLGGDAVSLGLLGENAALAEDDDVAARELLLELVHDALLDAVEVLDEAERDEDNHSLLAITEIDLLGARNLDRLELGLELSVGVRLELEEVLSDDVLEGGGLNTLRLGELAAGSESHRANQTKINVDKIFSRLIKIAPY